ncbi:hypothetical protein [Halarchaeum sp. P4]|uniref:hypothetical protein n=1 Tax=Halarchaeum sp. P4 TaxID=3421639 RepID=UPI003EBA70AA
MSEPFSRRTLAVLLVVGILGPGMAHYYVNRAGFPLVADALYVGGYLTAVFLVWYGWLRHVELTG